MRVLDRWQRPPRNNPRRVLFVGITVASFGGQFDIEDIRLSRSQPVLVRPSFDIGSIFSIGLPLTLLAGATQSVPGVGILWANDYRPPINAITISGFASVLTAPLVVS